MGAGGASGDWACRLPAMRRLQVVELHDLPGFPAVWRDLGTDFMSWYASAFRPYRHAVPVLAEALRLSGATGVLDLCSGGAGPILALKPALDRALGAPLRVTLTDKYPNRAAFAAAAARFPGEVEAVPDAVDATAVPEALDGFRTLLGSFHHFSPAAARAILEDAVRARRGVAVLEYTERRPLLWALPLLVTPALIWLATPLIRPFSWRRLLWTYLLPVVPLYLPVDGLVSVLRSYTPAELADLARGLDDPGYRWQVGQVGAVGASRATYLIGVPGEGGAGAGGD